MQVLNIIHGQLLFVKNIERGLHIWSATDKRGEHTATMVSNRGEKRAPGSRSSTRRENRAVARKPFASDFKSHYSSHERGRKVPEKSQIAFLVGPGLLGPPQN